MASFHINASICLISYFILLFAVMKVERDVGAHRLMHANDDAFSQMHMTMDTTPNLSKYDCSSACNRRCSKAQEHEPCLKYCGICCAKCQCVPPGTYGNKEACGSCYANWTTHGGKPKCP